MKRLFVSVPMKGRTEVEIKASIQKMKKIAEIYEGEELELIDSYIEEEEPENCNRGIWYLAKSIERLARSDVFIGIDETYDWRGCEVEDRTAFLYGIKRYTTPARYVIDNYDALWNKLHPICCDEVPKVQ